MVDPLRVLYYIYLAVTTIVGVKNYRQAQKLKRKGFYNEFRTSKKIF